MKRTRFFNTLMILMALLLSITSCATGQNSNNADFWKETLIIGNQEWMIENLNVSTFRNGDPIPEAKTAEEWIRAWRDGTPAWSYYDNDSANGEKYGKLYNRFAVEDLRDLCHENWHIPTPGDFETLVNTVGSEAGKKLKSASNWDDDGDGTNSSGFNAPPGGSRYGNGGFYGKGDYAVFGTSEGRNFHLTKYGSLRGEAGYGRMGLSLRCVRRKVYEDFDIVPSGVPNPGILFVNHEETGRSGHSFSTITEAKNGDILAFYGNTSGIVHGGHLYAGWTEYKRSKDGGKTWGDPVIFEHSKKVWDENKKTADGTSYNQAMIKTVITAPNGNLVAMAGPIYHISYDNGDTWSRPRVFDEFAKRSVDRMESRNNSFVHDGTIYVVFAELFGGPGGWQNRKSYAFYASTDNGETFTRRSDHLFANRLYHRLSGYHTGAVLDDGSFIVYSYSDEEEQTAPYVISKDNGYTWSKVNYTFFEKKIRNIQMSEKVGDYYFIHGRTGNRGYDTGNFVLYKSKDGINWDSGLFLNRGEGVAGPGSDAYSVNEVIGKYNPSIPNRLLIQSSISYAASRVNLKHWWLNNISGTNMGN